MTKDEVALLVHSLDGCVFVWVLSTYIHIGKIEFRDGGILFSADSLISVKDGKVAPANSEPYTFGVDYIYDGEVYMFFIDGDWLVECIGDRRRYTDEQNSHIEWVKANTARVLECANNV